jgi:hypothetical protein
MLGRIHSGLRNQWMGALALFLVVAGGGAYAAFDPVGGDGDIDACFEKKSGDLDLQKGRRCGKAEKPVAWSQVGPVGPVGPQGEPGQQGLQGAQGDQGLPGSDGAPGSAVGYAFIRADGTSDAARSKNLLGSALTSGNIYCLRFATAPKNIVTTVDSASAGFATATLDTASIQTNCGVVLPNANAFALTIGAGNPFAGVPKAFYVAVN